MTMRLRFSAPSLRACEEDSVSRHESVVVEGELHTPRRVPTLESRARARTTRLKEPPGISLFAPLTSASPPDRERKETPVCRVQGGRSGRSSVFRRRGGGSGRLRGGRSGRGGVCGSLGGGLGAPALLGLAARVIYSGGGVGVRALRGRRHEPRRGRRVWLPRRRRRRRGLCSPLRRHRRRSLLCPARRRRGQPSH